MKKLTTNKTKECATKQALKILTILNIHACFRTNLLQNTFVRFAKGTLILIWLGIITILATGCSVSRKPVFVSLQTTQDKTQQTNSMPTAPFEIQQVKIEQPNRIISSAQTNPPPLIKTNTWQGIDAISNISVKYFNEVYPKRCLITHVDRQIELTEDTLVCKFNGININLGFNPRWENGRCKVHNADYTSTILPLLEPKQNHNGRKPVVVIDPGHGGNDPGTLNIINNKPEKEYTLDIAKRLATLLDSRGWAVVLTRTNDIRVERSARVQFSQNANADVFVSIHFNFFDKSVNVRGIETYCLTPNGVPSTFNRGFTDNSATNYLNNRFDTENIVLAALIHKNLLNKTKTVDRGVRRARFMEVLQNQNCPSVLIEAGFLSSRTEANLIDTAEYRQSIAEAIADGLKEYYNHRN